MSKKKILIVMTDAGNAHTVTAKALEQAFDEKFPEKYDIKIMDLLKEADVEPFNTSEISYPLVSQNTLLESLNIFLTNLLNTGIGYDLFYDYVNLRMYKECVDIIKHEKPDIVISNHPIPSIVISQIKKKIGGFKYVVTMLDLMNFYRSLADKSADLIFAPTGDAATGLVKYGADIKKIIYPLFPLHPKLKNFRKREEVLKELGLAEDKPVIFITGGGLGGKSLTRVIQRLAERDDLQLIIAAGKLEYFKRELERKFKDRKGVVVLGFINNMQDYFNACDIVIGKPGATTVMEMEVFNKKAIFTKRVGHVEVGHDEYIKRNPLFRYVGSDNGKLEEALEELLKTEIHPSAVKTSRKFDEAYTIAAEIDKLI